VLTRIDHVGIAVRDLDRAVELYERRLGVRVTAREKVVTEGVEVAMIPLGESRVELLSPLGADSPLTKFLEQRGEALHHVAYHTADVDAALTVARSAGAEVATDRSRPGAHGTRIGFIHPKSLCGVLTELVQDDGQPRS
jgi:methylmalonyl-CoA/ethylmalonyl-CoA epimerase